MSHDARTGQDAEPADAQPPSLLCQSILTIVVPHFSDGSMRDLQLRTAGPLEQQPAVAAQILRQLADQLDPVRRRIVTATGLPPRQT